MQIPSAFDQFMASWLVLTLKGPDISGRMREILIDWLIEVHHRFELIQRLFDREKLDQT